MFVSYRRDHSTTEARLVRRAIEDKIGEGTVFIDEEDLRGGPGWQDQLDAVLSSPALLCTVLIVNAPLDKRHGENWWTLSKEPGGSPRLHDPEDVIFHEMERSLECEGAELIVALHDNESTLPTEQYVNHAPERTKRVLGRLTEGHVRQQFRTNTDHGLELLVADIAELFEQRVGRTLGDVYGVQDLMARGNLGAIEQRFQMLRPTSDVREAALDAVLRMCHREWDAARDQIQWASSAGPVAAGALPSPARGGPLGWVHDLASESQPQVAPSGPPQLPGTPSAGELTPGVAPSSDAAAGRSHGELDRQITDAYWSSFGLLCCALSALRGERPRRVPEVGLARHVITGLLFPAISGFAAVVEAIDQTTSPAGQEPAIATAASTGLYQSTLVAYLVLYDYFVNRRIKVWAHSGPQENDRLARVLSAALSAQGDRMEPDLRILEQHRLLYTTGYLQQTGAQR